MTPFTDEDEERLGSLCLGAPDPRAGDLAQLVRAAIRRHREQADRAAEARRKRSQRVREGIRRAIGPKPLVWTRIAQIESRIRRYGPAYFGLDCQPDRATISSVVKEEWVRARDAKDFESKPAAQHPCATYAHVSTPLIPSST